jgi:hypothetical protein
MVDSYVAPRNDYLLSADTSCISVFFKRDSSYFMATFYIFVALILLTLWITTYQILTDTELIQQRLIFWKKKIALIEIESIRPHRLNMKGGRGTVIDIIGNNKCITLQPANAQFVLAELHRLAPQAEFLF